MNYKLSFAVDGEDFSSAGDASSATKHALRKIGLAPEIIRRVAVCMYEGEINMVIHARGGVAEVEVDDSRVYIVLTDKGPGIPDVFAALREGYSTATSEIRERGFGAGMGLPNMKRYADEIDIQTELGVGTKVSMVIYL